MLSIAYITALADILSKNRSMAKGINYLIIGTCTGILIGLSLSPVIEKTLGILLASITSLVGIASGITLNTEEKNQRFKINPIPLTLIMTGIVFGSLLGIYARNKNLLGNTKTIVQEQQNLNSENQGKQNKTVTGLHSSETMPCNILENLHGNELRMELEKIGDSTINKCLEISSDSLSLEVLKRALCK